MRFKYVRTFFYLVTLLGIVIFLFYNKDDIIQVSKISIHSMALLAAVNLIAVYLLALFFKNSITIFNIKLPFKEWFGLTVSNTMYNYLLPVRGGLALRAIYLQRNYKFPYSNYISFTAGTYILNLFSTILLANILGILFLLSGKLSNIIFIYISIGLFIGMIGLFIILYTFNPDRIPEKNKILRFLKNAGIGMKQFSSHSKLITSLIMIHVAFILAISLRLYLSYYVLGVNIFFWKLVFINSLVAFSMVFSITPGNFGIKEGIIGLSASLLNISIEEALLGALVDRIVAIIVVFALGLIFSRILLKKIELKTTF